MADDATETYDTTKEGKFFGKSMSNLILLTCLFSEESFSFYRIMYRSFEFPAFLTKYRLCVSRREESKFNFQIAILSQPNK